MTSGSGGIALNTGAVLTGPTIDLNGAGGGIALSGNAKLGQSGGLVDLTASGVGVSEAATSTILAATLQSTGGVAGPVALLGSANAVATIGGFAVTGAGDSFTLVDTGNLAVPGALTAAQDVVLSTVGAGTISATGSIGAGRTLSVTSGSGGIALNTGAALTGPTIVLNGAAGGIALTGNASLGQAGGLLDLTASAVGVSEAATSTMLAATLQSSGGVAGPVSLLGSANAVAAIGRFAVTGTGDSFTLVDTGNLAVSGALTAVQNVTLSTVGAGAISATGSIGAGATLAVTSGAGGIALNNGAVLTAPTIDLNGAAGGIVLTGNAALGKSGGLVDLTTTAGGVTEAATSIVTAATLQSAAGISGNTTLAGTANAIASLAKFVVTSGSLTLVDTGTLAASGPVSASNVTVNTVGAGAITDSGSITATGTLALTSGTGGIGLGSGAVVSAPTIDLNSGGGALTLSGNAALGNPVALVDLTTIAGGVSEATTATITAATLQSAAGVTGNVNLAGTANAIAALNNFIVTTGSLILVDTGTLAISGPVSAANIAANTVGNGAITDSGTVTAAGTLALTSGTGGIGLGAGAVVSAPTIDLNGNGGAIALTSNAVLGNVAALVDLTTTAGGASEAATAQILAATLQSAAGVTGNTTLAGTANAVAALGRFVVSGGSLTMVDTGSLAISGPVSATNVAVNTVGTGAITDSGSITAAGTLALTSGSGGIGLGSGAVVSAPTIDLNGGGGAITLTGNAMLGNAAALVDLTTTAGGVSEAATAQIVATTLQSAAGVTGSVGLVGTANAVANLANFVVTGGDFTLLDTGNLGVAGPLSATNVSLTTDGASSITATGSILATANLHLTSGSGGQVTNVSGVSQGFNVPSGSGSIVLANGAVVAAPFIGLSSGTGGLTLSGNAALGQAGALVDLATTGGITEAASSSLTAATLQSVNGVTGTTTLAGTANAVSTLSQFVVSGGNFSLLDTGALNVISTVSAGNVTVTDTGAAPITVTGTLGATTKLAVTSGSGGVGLGNGAIVTGATIDLNGAGGPISLTGNARLGGAAALVDVTTTAGGVSETTGATLTAATLSSVSGVGGSVALAGTANAVATIGPFAVTGGNFTLTNTGSFAFNAPVSATNIAATTSGSGAITVNSTVAANPTSGLLQLVSGTGGVVMNGGGVLTGGTVDVTTTSGGITEASSAAINAGTLQSAGGVVGTVVLPGTANQIAAIGNFAIPAGKGTFSLFDASALTVSGVLAADAVSLDALGNIAITGSVIDPAAGSVSLISANGAITETGTLVAALLSGSSGGNTSLTGSTASTNQVTDLGNFSANGGKFTLNDGVGLLISGTVDATTINIDVGTNAIVLGNGAGFITGGVGRPNGTLLVTQLPPAGTTTLGAYLTGGSFTQIGSSTVAGQGGGPSILSIDVTGNIQFSTSGGLTGPGTWLVLGLTGGQATGTMVVEALDVSYSSSTAGSDLQATVNNYTGNAAAGAAFLGPTLDPNFHVNSCPIHSVNCVLLPTESLPTANPLNDIFFGSFFGPQDEGDLLLPIVSDEEY